MLEYPFPLLFGLRDVVLEHDYPLRQETLMPDPVDISAVMFPELVDLLPVGRWQMLPTVLYPLKLWT